MNGQNALPSGVRVARVAALGAGLIDPEGMRVGVGAANDDACEVLFGAERVFKFGIDRRPLQRRPHSRWIGNGMQHRFHSLGKRSKRPVLKPARHALIPVVHRRIVDPAAVSGDGLVPLGIAGEELLVPPVDVPLQRLVEPDRHVVVEAVD